MSPESLQKELDLMARGDSRMVLLFTRLASASVMKVKITRQTIQLLFLLRVTKIKRK